jgi:hypothetical protein
MDNNPNPFFLKMFGDSYFLALPMPTDEHLIPQWIEFRRLIASREEVLTDEGWSTEGEPRKFKAHPDGGRFFTYHIDQGVHSVVSYMVRKYVAGSYTAWRAAEDCNTVVLPAPKKPKVKVT